MYILTNPYSSLPFFSSLSTFTQLFLFWSIMLSQLSSFFFLPRLSTPYSTISPYCLPYPHPLLLFVVEVCHDSSIHVPWLIQSCAMTNSYVCQHLMIRSFRAVWQHGTLPGNMYVHIHICAHLYIYVHIYIFMCVYISVYIYLYT